ELEPGFGKRTAQGGRPGQGRQHTRSFGRKKPATGNPWETPSSSTVHVSDPTDRLGALELPAPPVGLKRVPQSSLDASEARHRGRERSSRLSPQAHSPAACEVAIDGEGSEVVPSLLRINFGFCSSRFER
ncbi:hypothetical protein PVAP13_9NG554714, partial [Panicum virgatum]